MEHYIGVDLGKQFSYFVIKDHAGRILQRGKVVNDSVAIRAMLKPFLGTRNHAVMEATTNYYWMYQQLKNLSIEVKLAHPLKTRAIASAKIKNDRLDATVLADLLRGDLIPESYVPDEQIRQMRELTRQHIRLTQILTRIKNQCHALLTKLNLRTEDASDLFGVKGRQWLRQLQLPPVFEFQKQQLLDQVEYYKSLIHKADWQIEKYLQQFPETQSLQELPGIGKFSAALIIAEIGRVERFSNPKQLVSYAGLAPGLYESGQTSHSRGITHQGSKYLRWILCEAAHRHIRKPGPLKDFYLRLRPAKGHGKALIATARKLLVQIYYILKDEKLQVTLDMPAPVPGLS